MCRHAKEKSCRSLSKSFKKAGGPGQIVHHELSADGNRAYKRTETKIMAQRAHRIYARRFVKMPVCSDSASVCQ